jgi:hypothetical protein
MYANNGLSQKELTARKSAGQMKTASVSDYEIRKILTSIRFDL